MQTGKYPFTKTDGGQLWVLRSFICCITFDRFETDESCPVARCRAWVCLLRNFRFLIENVVQSQEGLHFSEARDSPESKSIVRMYLQQTA